MAARSVAATPFKGDSFPAYVVTRTGGATRPTSEVPPTAIVLAAPQPLQITKGPTVDTIVSHSSTYSPAHAPIEITRTAVGKPVLARKPSPHNCDHRTNLTAHAYVRLSNIAEGLGQKPFMETIAYLKQRRFGRLDCRFPCPVKFAADHCSYLFQHPFASKEIQMIMYYRDMRQTNLNLLERSFRFRVDHPLEQFGEDYRPSNPHHFLKLVFATASETQRVKNFLAKRTGLLEAASHNNQDQ